MAVTKIWTIHEGSNIKQVLDYAANEGKTVINIQVETDETYDLQERQQFQDVIDHTMTGYQDENDDMSNVLDYVARSTKTEQKKYVSAINCSPERSFHTHRVGKQAHGTICHAIHRRNFTSHQPYLSLL